MNLTPAAEGAPGLHTLPFDYIFKAVPTTTTIIPTNTSGTIDIIVICSKWALNYRKQIKRENKSLLPARFDSLVHPLNRRPSTGSSSIFESLNHTQRCKGSAHGRQYRFVVYRRDSNNNNNKKNIVGTDCQKSLQAPQAQHRIYSSNYIQYRKYGYI